MRLKYHFFILHFKDYACSSLIYEWLKFIVHNHTVILLYSLYGCAKLTFNESA
jgi:hypothetical protein